MRSRLLFIALVLLFAAAPTAEARLSFRTPRKLGNEPGTVIKRVPKKRTVRADSVRVRGRNSGKYPYVGRRTTPKRTYLP